MKTIIEQLDIPQEAISTIQPDITCLQIPPENLRNSVEYILNADPSAYVSAIIGQEINDALDLIYLFTGKSDLALRISLPTENPTIDSICDLTVAASFYEREAKGMLGIFFEGLDHPENLLLPEDTFRTPLRKNHPIKEE